MLLAYAADTDMQIRAARMDPPLKQTQFSDVRAVHGQRVIKTYVSGIRLPDDTENKVHLPGLQFSAQC
jgi:hypothetical protein